MERINMAPSTNHPDPVSMDTSYVSMEGHKDVSLLGKHCQLEYCNQLDFLPFKCQSCEKTFCLDHRSEGAHKCEKEGAWGKRRYLKKLETPSAGEGKRMRDAVAGNPCSEDSCKTILGTNNEGVTCDTCKRDYCIKHRFEEQHDCKNKVPLGAGPAQKAIDPARRKIFGIFASMKATANDAKKTVNDAKNKQLRAGTFGDTRAQVAALNELKKAADGDKKVVETQRVYLWVQADTKVAGAKKAMFFNKSWVIGRLLDDVAKKVQIQNDNNTNPDENTKLRVYHLVPVKDSTKKDVVKERSLEFNEKVEVLKNGDTIIVKRGPPMRD